MSLLSSSVDLVQHQAYLPRLTKISLATHWLKTSVLYQSNTVTGNLLQVVPKDELFDIFEKVHVEDGKHLGRDRLYVCRAEKNTGFSRKVVLSFVRMCQECQLQKSKESIKSLVTKPIRSSDFASKGQVDLIDMHAGGETNLPYNLLLVNQDHLTKFVVLRPLKSKTAIEVTSTLLDIFCLIGPPHILQSDNGRKFKNVNLAKMVRELWPSCRIVNGKP